MLKLGMKQLGEWAEAYVENETCIHEIPDEGLTDQQKAGLMLIELVRTL